jgi:hypothetical protein
MTTTPEDVAAPAGDVTVFRGSPARTFAVMFVSFLIVWPVVNVLISWLLGDADPDPWWGVLLQAALIGAGVAAMLTFVTPGPPATWIRTSSGGLELSAAGSDPIHLAWADITHIAIRRKLLRRFLEVTPVDMGRVNRVRDGHGLPRSQDGVFIVDLSRVAPGPQSLRRELVRWMS